MNKSQEFRDRFDLIEYAKGRFQGYVTSGKNILINCPYHADNTPSMLVDPKRVYCFACQATADAIDFVAYVEGRTKQEVISGAGLGNFTRSRSIPKRSRVAYERPDERYVTRGVAALRRKQNRESLAYLYSRGIEDTSVRYWNIGYMRPPIKKCKYPRLSFPCYDEHDRLISIVYRADPRYEPNSRSKYVIHPHTPATMFGIAEVASCRGFLYAGGQIDAIMLHQSGYPAIGVSGEGTFKMEWLHQIGRQEVCLMLDNDKAGRAATKRLLELIPNAIALQWPSGTEGYDASDLINDEVYGTDAVDWMLADVGKNKRGLREV